MYTGAVPTAQFVHLHFVDEKYHEQHSQLLHMLTQLRRHSI